MHTVRDLPLEPMNVILNDFILSMCILFLCERKVTSIFAFKMVQVQNLK